MNLPTLGVNVQTLRWDTTDGVVNFETWDTSGQGNFSSIRQGYYKGADAAIIISDVFTYEHVKNWYNDVRKVCPEIPIALVINKIDLKDKDHNLKLKMINTHQLLEIQDFATSVKICYNYKTPFTYLMKVLKNNPNLELIEFGDDENIKNDPKLELIKLGDHE